MTVNNQDWNAAVWGTPAATPTAGNDYVVDGGGVLGGLLLRMPAGSADSTFGGDSLSLVNGGRGLLKTINTTATINGPLTLDFGWLQLGQNSNSTGTFVATQLIVNGTGNVISNGFSGQRFIIDAAMVGSGDILIDYAQGDDGGGRDIVFNNVGGYFGAISVTQNMDLEFASDVTFGGSISLSDRGKLRVLSGQTLTFDFGALSDEVNGTLAPGTYSGVSLDALGANYVNEGGTIIVASGVPLAITAISYDADAVTLTWTKTGASSYVAKYSTDMTNWGADMGDGLTDSIDENPDDADHITVTFDLTVYQIADEPDLFFRIEEE